ncbi:MAG TPA: hypothetical protein VHD36_17925 [Pirellulales bacterium]|nr:hypothetical protein [Pirellulales bacterium]
MTARIGKTRDVVCRWWFLRRSRSCESGCASRGLCIAVALFLAIHCALARADSSDERFLDGLRQRQLFSLAEKFCRDRLARDELPEDRRALFAIELSRTLVEEALQSPPEKRDELWKQSLATVDDFARRYPQSPRLVQIRVQRALVQLAWGELLAQELDTGGARDARLTAARDHLRQAIEELEKGIEKIAELQRRLQPSRKPAPGELSTSELRSLERNSQYQLARALRRQGESYPLESADRANSLTQAGELLRVLAQGDVEDPLTWPSRLDATTCYRLLGHLEAATRRLDQLDEESPPPRAQLRARAERMRVALAEKHVSEALALVEKGRVVEDFISADLDLATLEVYLAAWRAAVDAGEKSQASAWQEKAAAVVRDIERDHGPYWRRRGESLFAEQIAANPGTTDVGVLAKAAEGFYRAGQPDEALAAFDRAVREAHTAGQDAKAFELGYAAAAIEQERKNYAAAAERFRQAALAAPDDPQAAASHLMAIYDLGLLARSGAAEPLAHYTKLLEEHLETWPKAETVDRAHLWLARVRERDRQWQQAAEQYAAVRPAMDESPEAAAGLARAYRELLAELRAAGKPTAAAASAALAALQTASGLKQTAPDAWNAEQLAALLAIAGIWLEYTEDGAAKAERALEVALSQSQAASDEWKASAHALLAYSLAAQGRVEDAERQLDEVAGAGPAALETLVAGLDRLGATAQPGLKRNLAALELRALARIKAGSAEINDEQRAALTLARTRALVAAGRGDEAAAELRQLAAQHPRDGHIQEALATALWEAKDPGALAAWQNIEVKSRSGGERWMRAKLHEALIYDQRGQRERAAQTINVVKTLYPEMGGAEMKQRFLDVLKRNE